MITKKQFEQAKLAAIRDGFGAGLLEAGKNSSQVVAVSADLSDSIRMTSFANNFPDRFFEVGVAEQNLIGVAAGLAAEGLTAFAGSYAAFSPGRNHDQIRVSVCYSNLNVKVVGGHGGLTVGPDGATHQALEDIALTRVLPNMTVLVPSDYSSALKLTLQAAKLKTPVYIRLSRTTSKNLLGAADLRIGSTVNMMSGSDLTIVSTGILVDRALELAWSLLTQGIKAEVINVHTIKPLDETAIIQSAAKTKHVMTLEEHQKFGGLGSAVAEVLGQHCPTALEIVGVDDQFGESGEATELLNKYGFSLPVLKQKALNLLARQ